MNVTAMDTRRLARRYQPSQASITTQQSLFGEIIAPIQFRSTGDPFSVSDAMLGALLGGIVSGLVWALIFGNRPQIFFEEKAQELRGDKGAGDPYEG